MNISYFKFIISICIVFAWVCLIFSGGVKKQFFIQGNTREVYNAITKEIVKMGGGYEQFGGQVIYGFTLEVSFLNLEKYDEKIIFDQVKLLGFELKNVEKGRFYYFCRNGNGLVFTKKSISSFRIDYKNKDSYCL